MLALLGQRRLWVALAILLSLILGAGLSVYYWLLADLPSLDDLHGYAAAPSSRKAESEHPKFTLDA